MKKILQSITIVLMLGLLFTGTGFAQEIQMTKPASAGELPDYTAKDGEWIGYYQSVNDNALGLGGDGAQWNAAIRWMPADLEAFEGYAVTKIRVFINDEPNDGMVKIWQGNPDIANDEWPDEYVSQAMSGLGDEVWVEVELFDPYLIDITMELWIGWEMGDKGDGNFPAAFDDQNPVVGYSDLLQFGTNPWQPGANFGFDIAWNIEAFVVPGGDPDPDPDPDPDDTYTVTFNVDMTGVEGFDPEEHHVFMTGSFVDWAEPGSEGSVQLMMVPPAKSKDIILYEDFASGQFPDGWQNLDADGDGNAWFIVPENHDPVEGDFAIASASWEGGNVLTPDNWLITPQIMNVQADYELSFWVKAQDDSWANETYDVLISTGTSVPAEFVSVWNETLESDTWLLREVDLSAYEGEDIYIAFRHWDSEDWFRIVLDVIMVTGTPDNGNGNGDEEWIFTATVDEVPAGEIQYKYFSDAFGAGWDGGEWPGDPNRVADITADITLNDVWGIPPDDDDDDTSVTEISIQDIQAYPNPASSNLNVVSNSLMNNITVFDITGRVVISTDVNDNSHVLDVSTLNNGLYIMQVNTVDGVEGLRFHVVK